jgi:hypothetical protein
VYDEGRSIELYSGRVAIDIFSDTFARARAAALELRPLNAAGSATGPLPPPVYCPGLYGAQEPRLQRAMRRLPGHACQTAATQVAFANSLRLASTSTSTSSSATVSRAARPETRRTPRSMDGRRSGL